MHDGAYTGGEISWILKFGTKEFPYLHSREPLHALMPVLPVAVSTCTSSLRGWRTLNSSRLAEPRDIVSKKSSLYSTVKVLQLLARDQ